MADEPYDPYEHQTQNNNRSGRHKSPAERNRKSRSRSRSPRDRDWKKSERRQDRDHGGRSSRGHGMREKDAKVRLYVSNIPYDIRWQDLKDVFREKVGNVVTFVEIYESPEGKSVGAGVIEIRGADNALKAIEQLHKTQINGRSIIVREEREKDRMRHQKMMRMDEMGDGNGILGPGIGAGMGGGMGGGNMGGGGGGGNMGMGNWGMGGGGMGPTGGMGVGAGGGGLSMAGGMGMGNVGGGGGMGMGTMMGNMAASPVANMGGVTGGGVANTPVSGINPQILQQLGIDPNCVTDQVFVANLDYNVTESKLKEVFRMAGRIIDAEIRYDKEGKSRGIGLVKYEYPMEAVQAISMFNGQMLFDRMMSVRMDKLADQPNQQMPAKLPSGLMSIGMGLGLGGTPIRVEDTVGVGSMGGMGGAVANLGGAGMGGVGTNLPTGLGGIGNTGMAAGMGGGLASGIPVNMAGAGGTGNFGSQDVALGGGLSSSFGNRAVGMGGGRMSGGGSGGMESLVGMDNGILGSYTGNMGAVGMQQTNRSEGRSRASDSVQVRNIPFSMSWQNLRDKFNDVGDVRYAEIQMTADGRSKGVGVVRFHSPEDARRAVNLMHGLRIDGRQIDVRLEK